MTITLLVILLIVGALIAAAIAFGVPAFARRRARLEASASPPQLKVRLGLKPVDGLEQPTLEGYTYTLEGSMIHLVAARSLEATDGPEGTLRELQLGGTVVVPSRNLLFAQVLSE